MINRRRRFLLIAIAIIAAGAAIRLAGIGSALEYDEIWTLEHYASLPVSEIFRSLALPNNHPLNTLAVKLTLFPDAAPQWIRLVPLLAGIAAIPLAGLVSLLLWKRRDAALWGMFFLAFLPAAIGYSQQARGYSLQLLLLLAFTAGLLSARRHRIAGCMLIILGAAGSMLTLPTSAIYLAAIGSAAAWNCRKDWKKHLPQAASLAAAAAFTLFWCLLNYRAFQSARSWGIAIDSPAAWLAFVWDTLTGSAGPLLLPAGFAFVFGFRRTMPILWLWLFAMAIAVPFNGGPVRTYLPAGAAIALGAGFGAGLLLRRLPGRSRFWVGIILGVLPFLQLATAAPKPDWYALFREMKSMPPEVLVTYRATDAYPLGWNNRPESYLDSYRRLLPQPKPRTLLTVGTKAAISGIDRNGAEQSIPLAAAGLPYAAAGSDAQFHALDELYDAPETGDVVLAAVAPQPEARAMELTRQLTGTGQEFLMLNYHLLPAVTQNGKQLLGFLLAAKIERPSAFDWKEFLTSSRGAVTLFRVRNPNISR